MRKLRVMGMMHEDLIPPDTLDGYTEKEMMAWKTEFYVMEGMRALGHETLACGVSDDLGVLRKAILEFKPHVVFNLLEEFHQVETYDQHVVSYLELMKQHYTGCNPRGLMLAHDKALSKKILTYHHIRTPLFVAFPKGKKVRKPARLKYPLFVKSLTEEGSFGLAQASIVHNDAKLAERVAYLHSLGTHVMAEEYIRGREVYAPILGHRRLEVLPIVELAFKNLPDGVEPIATQRVKWDWSYQDKHGIESEVDPDMPEETKERIRKLGKRVYKALGLSGYARIDMRLTEEGELYVLEANPNPDVSYGEEMCSAAEAAGMSYHEFLQRILNLGLSYQAEWRRVGL